MHSNFEKAISALVCLFCTSSLSAQSIDGIYQLSGSNWSCSPDQIGMDGGALAIQNGVFEGVENRCDLTSPTKVDNGLRYTAVCSAEGSTYSEPITITPTSNGVKIDRNGYTFYWSRCEAHKAQSTNPRKMDL